MPACTRRQPPQNITCSLQSLRVCLFVPNCSHTPVRFSFFIFGCWYKACLKAGGKCLWAAASSARVLLFQLRFWQSFLIFFIAYLPDDCSAVGVGWELGSSGKLQHEQLAPYPLCFPQGKHKCTSLPWPPELFLCGYMLPSSNVLRLPTCYS